MYCIYLFKAGGGVKPVVVLLATEHLCGGRWVHALLKGTLLIITACLVHLVLVFPTGVEM